MEPDLECPDCGWFEHLFLGRLGSLYHFRCRDCGLTWALREDDICWNDDLINLTSD